MKVCRKALTGSGSQRRPSPFTQRRGVVPKRTSNSRLQITAIGYVRKEYDGRYKGHLRTVSIQAEIDIVPNQQKYFDNQPDFRVMTQGIEISAGWQKTGETSGKENVSLCIDVPEFGPKKPFPDRDRAAGPLRRDLES